MLKIELTEQEREDLVEALKGWAGEQSGVGPESSAFIKRLWDLHDRLLSPPRQTGALTLEALLKAKAALKRNDFAPLAEILKDSPVVKIPLKQ